MDSLLSDVSYILAYCTQCTSSCRQHGHYVPRTCFGRLNIKSSQQVVLWTCNSIKFRRCFSFWENNGLLQHFVYPSRLVWCIFTLPYGAMVAQAFFCIKENLSVPSFCSCYSRNILFSRVEMTRPTLLLAPNTCTLQLETDPDILLQKAEAALRKYGMNVVVANELANYKDVVVMVTSNGRTTVRRPSKEDDVEEQLIDLLVEMHSEHIMQLNQDVHKLT